MAALIGLAASPARANTYLFTVTGQNLLDALFNDTTSEQQAGYFAIWLQPQLPHGVSYTYQSVASPNPTSQDAWNANTINDPSSPYLTAGTWAEYNKLSTTNNVALLSDANNNGTPAQNIFLNHNFTGSGTPSVPYGWGTRQQTINQVIDTNSSFSFAITTASALSGSYTLSGVASALISGSTTSMDGTTKDYSGIDFTLTASVAQATPEPGTWLLLTCGLGSLLIGRLRRKPPEPLAVRQRASGAAACGNG